MPTPRLRRVADVFEFDRAVDEYRLRGYEVLRRNAENAHLRKADRGKLAGHLLLAMMTLGIGNLIYLRMCQARADQIIIRIEPRPDVTGSSAGSRKSSDS